MIRIQPDEGVSLTFEVKPPGPEICVSPLSLDFKYEQAFGNSPPEAYETLLEDCIEGDSTLYTRHDWVEQAWALVDPIIKTWDKTKPTNFPNYEAGSWGPKEADELLQRDWTALALPLSRSATTNLREGTVESLIQDQDTQFDAFGPQFRRRSMNIGNDRGLW